MRHAKRWLLLGVVVATALVAVLIMWRPPTPATPSATSCEGRAATITGNPDVIDLVGTEGDDVIVGHGHNHILAGGGDDLICAPSVGGDKIDAGAGNDRVIGGDFVHGGAGRDHLTVTNATLADGGPGDDRIDSSGLAGTIDGGPGDDVIVSTGSSHMTTGGAGNDRVTETNGRNTRGGTGRDRLIGHGRGNLSGDEGDDRLEADAEATVTLWDGAGNDTYDANRNRQVTVNYYFSPRPVRVDLAARRATGHGRDRLLDVVSVAGSHHADVLVGDRSANTLSGLIWWEGDRDDPAAAGADRISGGGGDDVVEALGPGSVVRGEAGNDRLRVSGRGLGGPGADVLVGGDADDGLFGGPGHDSVDGGEGTDRCTAEAVTNCER